MIKHGLMILKRVLLSASLVLSILCTAFAKSQTDDGEIVKNESSNSRVSIGHTDNDDKEAAYLNTVSENITGDKLFQYVKELSDSVKYQGRLAGSQGMENAVNWVKSKFSEWGIEKLSGTDEYLQIYPHPCVEVMYGSSLAVDGQTYPWADGWYAGGTSGNGCVEAEIVYAGYGVTAPELGYDDYTGIDVKGKIVLIAGETPNTSNNADSLRMWYNHTLHHNKLANAVAHGAIGMLYIWVPGPNNGYDSTFVYAFVKDTIVNDIFKGSGKKYIDVVKTIRRTQIPQSFNTGKTAKINMITKYNPNATGKNVIGVIKGSDPRLCGEYIILSAHLDHLGMIPYHIAGANDNNSSTAALLGVAEALAKSEIKPKRSVIFMNLDGEEAGLTGSSYYVAHPLVPKENVKIIYNLEQLGIGTGFAVSFKYDKPFITHDIKAANTQYVKTKLSVYPNRHITRPRTDGAVFMKSGYSVIDLSGSGGKRYYHTPKDNWDTMNPAMLENAAKLLFWSIVGSADE